MVSWTDFDYHEYRPFPESTSCLKAIFKEIDEAHPLSSTSTYTLQKDAKLQFISEVLQKKNAERIFGEDAYYQWKLIQVQEISFDPCMPLQHSKE